MVARFFAISDNSGTVSPFLMRILLTGSHSGAITDYQSLHTITYESEMQVDFDDIRFVTDSGVHIPYWIESKTDSTTAEVWIKSGIVDGSTPIWMYYGNAELSSGSSITGIFIQGDDFEWGNDGDPITDNGGGITWSIKTGNIDISTDHSLSGTRSMQLVGNNPRSVVRFYQSTGEDYIIRARIWKTTGQHFGIVHDDGSTEVYAEYSIYGQSDDDIGYYTDSHIDTGYDGQVEEWITMEIRDIDWTANTYDIFFKDSVLNQVVKDATPMRPLSVYDDGDLVLWTEPDETVWIDNVVIRKYVATEPTWAYSTPQHARTGNMIL